tara:strand:+ start:170 stop:892 length:723 start_codon:yes stop_codon:yes gene_type:complete
MTKKPITLCTLALILLAAAYAEASSLIQNSPFLPPFYEKAATKPIKEMSSNKSDITRFTLKGISRIGPHYYFSIYDSRTKKAEWVQAGVPYNGFIIKSYDPKMHQIEFTWEGKLGRINLGIKEEIAYKLVTESPDLAKRASQYLTGASRKTASSRGSQGRDNSVIVFSSQTNEEVSSNTPGNWNQYASTSSPQNQFGSTTTLYEEGGLPTSVATNEGNSLSIFPRTTVNNPNGKQPDHLR